MEVNHHFKIGGSFWKMINPTKIMVIRKPTCYKMVVGTSRGNLIVVGIVFSRDFSWSPGVAGRISHSSGWLGFFDTHLGGGEAGSPMESPCYSRVSHGSDRNDRIVSWLVYFTYLRDVSNLLFCRGHSYQFTKYDGHPSIPV